MAGCFGNSPEDRYHERKLDEYLDGQEGTGDVYDCTVVLEDDPEEQPWIKCPQCSNVFGLSEGTDHAEEILPLLTDYETTTEQIGDIAEDLACPHCEAGLVIEEIEC